MLTKATSNGFRFSVINYISVSSNSKYKYKI